MLITEQMSEIKKKVKRSNESDQLVKNYRCASGLAARELAWDDETDPEGNVYFVIERKAADIFRELAALVRWLFHQFRSQKINHSCDNSQ